MSESQLSQLFAGIDAGEVWGVGRKIEARLADMGITTILQLRGADPDLIRSKFSVVLEKTVRELRGVSCLDLEEVAPDKQQIMCSEATADTRMLVMWALKFFEANLTGRLMPESPLKANVRFGRNRPATTVFPS